MSNFLDSFSTYSISIFKNGVRLPAIIISPGQKASLGLALEATNLDYLKKLTWLKCLEKMRSGKLKGERQVYIDRFKTEFEVFVKTGTIDYILLLMDIFLWCDDQDIPRGPGRGSAAGSFTFFILGLTNVNPLEHDLNFTRFLNEARAKTHYVDDILHVDGKSFADFDGDVSFARRGEIIRRIEKDYAGKTCKILTLQYLTSKIALKETVKSFLEYSETEALNVTDKIESVFGKVDSLDKTTAKSKFFKEWSEANAEAFSIAKQIESLFRTAGQHASGVLVSYYPLNDIIPMELAATDEVVSGYDMEVCLSISLKADVLGLRSLDVMKIASDLSGIKYHDINIYDESIYKYLQASGLFYGLFQVEEGLTKQVVQKVKPKNIDQLAACISISRPGALKYIDDYVKFTSTGERKNIHPKVDQILEQTGGLILYQEQINQICQDIYGMSAIDADDVRRCLGKKDREGMAKWEPILRANGVKLNILEGVTNWFWETCNASADYLFNKNHCYSYSYITCYTTFLKANYPAAFYLGCLKMAQHESDPIICTSDIQSELTALDLKLLPPDILKSAEDFALEGPNIRMGFSGIKGLSEAALVKLRLFRSVVMNRFDLYASLEEAGLPLNVVTSLILSGCFDSIKGEISRNKCLFEFETWKLLTEKETVHCKSIGEKYDYDLFAVLKFLVEEMKDPKGRPGIKSSRHQTLKRNVELSRDKYVKNSKFTELSAWIFEQEFLGFSYSFKLKDIYSKWIQGLTTLYETKSETSGSKVRVVGIILELERRVSREKKTPYLKLSVKDDFSTATMMLFGEDRIASCDSFNGKELEAGDIVVINGKKSNDTIFIDTVTIQDNPIILKKSQLKKSNQVLI